MGCQPVGPARSAYAPHHDAGHWHATTCDHARSNTAATRHTQGCCQHLRPSGPYTASPATTASPNAPSSPCFIQNPSEMLHSESGHPSRGSPCPQSPHGPHVARAGAGRREHLLGPFWPDPARPGRPATVWPDKTGLWSRAGPGRAGPVGPGQ
jgi:hypothetical protein